MACLCVCHVHVAMIVTKHWKLIVSQSTGWWLFIFIICIRQLWWATAYRRKALSWHHLMLWLLSWLLLPPQCQKCPGLQNKPLKDNPWMLPCILTSAWMTMPLIHPNSISFQTLSMKVPFTFYFAVKGPSTTRLANRNHLQISRTRMMQTGRRCNRSTWRASAWGSAPQWEQGSND